MTWMMGHLRLLFVTALIALSIAMNPYKELGVTSGTTPEQIKKVKNKAKLYS